MPRYDLDDTIVAISTPVAIGAIGIVRLSGRDSIEIADKIFKAKSAKPLKNKGSFSISYGFIYEKDRVIDEVIISIMKGPRSYTKEDIVEINCHSGLAVLKRILELTVASGARLAEPGEFTKRAFLNGRIDLTQAESVLDIISSKTDLASGVALSHLEGVLSKKINDIKEKILGILVNLEAAVDFPEEDIEPASLKKLKSEIDFVLKDIDRLIDSSETGIILRSGLRCSICGRPNAGKSSLMNLILKKDRSIVSEIPGTTRDTIEETASIRGIPVNFTDTAGINDIPASPIEKEGITRAKKSIGLSDFIIFIIDASCDITNGDLKMMETFHNKKKIIVLNKIDLGKTPEIKKAAEFFRGTQVVEMSALLGTNIEGLEEAILKLILGGKEISQDALLISNTRHKTLLINAGKSVRNAMELFKQGGSLEFASSDLYDAVGNLNEIVGESISDDVLERIFSQFCVGK